MQQQQPQYGMPQPAAVPLMQQLLQPQQPGMYMPPQQQPLAFALPPAAAAGGHHLKSV
jgi:hypothetical protein